MKSSHILSRTLMPPSPQKESGREFIVASDKLWFRPLFRIPEVFAYESLFDCYFLFVSDGEHW